MHFAAVLPGRARGAAAGASISVHNLGERDHHRPPRRASRAGAAEPSGPGPSAAVVPRGAGALSCRRADVKHLAIKSSFITTFTSLFEEASSRPARAAARRSERRRRA
ncbi:hypothetical protein EVAR_64090_1 [Eumeta japonica]|uniref:Uncharacterized protein n=1 Tax=Eumeta variegata TaxID=151549 RepID=A0A4C1ZDV8_EUMVA|nr:hypothetical protein EVAR_64090_1 [Eumeta japonica]